MLFKVRYPVLVFLILLNTVSPTVYAGKSCQESKNVKSFPLLALTEYAAGYTNPVYLTSANSHDDRLYVVEQAGVVTVIKNGKRVPDVFLDISERVSSGGEKGLLSITFHPDYKKKPYVYVNYTSQEKTFGDLLTIVSRFKRNANGSLDAGSEQIILKIKQPFGNHNGGQIAFGPEGYLYIGMGDGGLAHDPFGHGQNINSLLGAMLRIDINSNSDKNHYTIPHDNPFVGHKNARHEIWAYGLRNPWRFSFDPETDELYVADVGQDKIEEIDVIEKGGNYGWNVMEGELCTSGKEHCNQEHYIQPIYSYPHPQGFAITGGYVYRGTAIPGLCGVYLFADYVSKRLWGLRYISGSVVAHQELMQLPDNISSFGTDGRGEIYLLGHQSGRIFKLIAKLKKQE